MHINKTMNVHSIDPELLTQWEIRLRIEKCNVPFLDFHIIFLIWISYCFMKMKPD